MESTALRDFAHHRPYGACPAPLVGTARNTVPYWIAMRGAFVLLRHKLRRPCVVGLAPQQGHRARFFTSARIKRMSIVAIEFGTWRSGRKGGSSGSITFG